MPTPVLGNAPVSTISKYLSDNVQTSIGSKWQQGIQVKKIDSVGQSAKRYLTVSQDKTALFCTHEPLDNYLSKKGSGFSLSNSFGNLKKNLKTLRDGGTGGGHSAVNRHIDVADLVDVYEGLVGTNKLEKSRKKDRLKGQLSDIDNERDQIVIIVHHSNATLNLLVEDPMERRELVIIIRQMLTYYAKARKLVDGEALLMRHVWYDIDMNKDNLISEKEFIAVLGRLNIEIKNPARYYRQFLKDHHICSEGLKYNECMVLFEKIKVDCFNGERSASEAIANEVWNRSFGSEMKEVTAQVFLYKFLYTVQHETDMTVEDAQMIIDEINSVEANRRDDSLSEKNLSKFRFELYLRMETNEAFDPRKQQLLSSRLDQPLAHYWINTSHNTYLLGDQLQSSSSVEMYMRALRRGCKCLELDCWDGDDPEETNDEVIPVVFHGHTLTSKIAFIEILHGVQTYLEIHPDTYPIILSLENHCSRQFQTAMARNLKDIFGSRLYVPPPGSATMDDLPSPEELRGMVVIKGKRPPTPDDAEADEEVDFDPYADNSGTGTATEDTTGAAGASADIDPINVKKGLPPKVVAELANLTLFHGTEFKSWEKSIVQPPSHMHSIGETKIPKLIKKNAKEASKWREYNQRHMTRTYPAGFRVDSSNYNPMLAWSVGSQLVALNFQTLDSSLILNDGRFRESGGCGYVLKPASVMGLATSDCTPINLAIRVVNAFYLPKPFGHTTGEIIDPYVSVALHDIKEGVLAGNSAEKQSKGERTEPTRNIASGTTSILKATTGNKTKAGGEGNEEVLDAAATYEATKEEYETPVVNNNGFAPVFQTTMNFTVHNPDCAMVVFHVKERDVGLNDWVAHSAIPFSCLRKGYRNVPLFDNHDTRSGAFNFASLFVEIMY